jgi:hypothetical protein
MLHASQEYEERLLSWILNVPIIDAITVLVMNRHALAVTGMALLAVRWLTRHARRLSAGLPKQA